MATPTTPTAPEDAQRWTGRHLLVAALVQLVLVRVAYCIDRSKSVPYLSTASWAILLGMVVRSGATVTSCRLDFLCFDADDNNDAPLY